MSRYKCTLIALILIIGIVLASSSGCVRHQAVETSVDNVVVEETAEPVKKSYDKLDLERRINEIISTRKGNWSVYVEVPNDNFGIEINNRNVLAASTIKLFNMVAFYNGINEGTIIATENDYKNLQAMITVSSNVASNEIVKTVGGGDFYKGADAVTDLSYNLGCYDTQEEHMLYDTGGHYAPGRNSTSVRDLGLLLKKIYKGECVSPEYDKEMTDLLKEQTRVWKIPAGVPEGVTVANKTGETSRVELDTAIVFSPECDYILCISVTDFGNAPVYITFNDISRTVYEFFNSEIADDERIVEYKDDERIVEYKIEVK